MSRPGPADELEASADAVARLHRAGWSIGDVGFHDGAGGLFWIVSGSNGENLIRAEGATRAGAWGRAVEQARGLGMLGRIPCLAPERFWCLFRFPVPLLLAGRLNLLGRWRR
jgi:hypothetical protein